MVNTHQTMLMVQKFSNIGLTGSKLTKATYRLHSSRYRSFF